MSGFGLSRGGDGNSTAGGGGGGGEGAQGWFSAATIGASQTVTIGGAGTTGGANAGVVGLIIIDEYS